MKVYYFNSRLENFGFKENLNKNLFGHGIKEDKNEVFIKPTKYNESSLSPFNFLNLKKTYNIKEIYMYDRVIGAHGEVLIIDHINRSGLFFLRGKTPHGKLTMFPDMSGVYKKNSKLKKSTVQTLGPKRFKAAKTEKGIVFSEGCAITASLWHYVGVRVKCFGFSQSKTNKKIKVF